MRNQRMYPWMVLRDKMEDPGLSGGDDPPTDDPGSNTNTDPNPNPSPTGIESPFAGIPGLEGKSPQEIASRLATMEATVREQGRALNDAARRGAEPPTPVTPEPEPEIDATQFFADPGKSLKAQEERIVNRLRKDLNEIIQPFREDLNTTRINQAWATVAEKYPDLNDYREYIETQLTQRGISDPNAGTIRLLYLDAKDSIGVNTAIADPKPRNTGDGNNRPAPPQHPASRQPINTQPAGPTKLRQLTESEKTIARMNRMTDEEYLKWLDVDERDVTSSKIGVKE